MKSTKRTRWVKFVTLTLGTTPHAEFGSSVDFSALLLEASERLLAGELLQRATPERAKQHARIVDIRLSETHAVILFKLVDRDGQDAVYEDIVSGDVETHTKSPKQGNRTTAHLAISLKGKIVGNSQQFRGVLEWVSGIPVGMVQQRMTTLGKRIGKGTGSLDGNKTSVEFSAIIKVEPFVERTIRQELSEGVLKRFTLVHAQPKDQGFDENRVIREDRRKVEIEVVAADAKQKLNDIFSAVKERAEGYELVRAYYESKDGRPASTAINIAKEDALDNLLSKVKLIELDQDVHPNQQSVDAHLALKLVHLLD